MLTMENINRLCNRAIIFMWIYSNFHATNPNCFINQWQIVALQHLYAADAQRANELFLLLLVDLLLVLKAGRLTGGKARNEAGTGCCLTCSTH